MKCKEDYVGRTVEVESPPGRMMSDLPVMPNDDAVRVIKAYVGRYAANMSIPWLRQASQNDRLITCAPLQLILLAATVAPTTCRRLHWFGSR